VNVDAIVFWLVWNAEKSILEVEDFVQAITTSAQTALRESIGRHELAQMITERESLGRELQRILDEKTNPWGITVQSVEIRDVRIPEALEDAMSRQAQAERKPAPSSARPKPKSPTSFRRPQQPTRTILSLCTGVP
jgi:regulator of protease activity HflC (stomatin/prohibitin superfamily)